MKKNRWALRAVVLLLVSSLLMVTVSVAAEAGSGNDPLVTLSYLKETFMEDVLKKVDDKIDVRNSQIARQLEGEITGGSGVASIFTVTQGQTLTGDIGCEVMLRVGSAVCVAPSAPGLIDESTAGTLNNGGALAQNHLYMMTIEGRGVKATAATTKLLVRGGYSIA